MDTQETNDTSLSVYLYPSYVDIDTALSFAYPIRNFFTERNIQLEARRWNGTIEGLPEKPSLVRASSQMRCSQEEFYKVCKENGHVGFYNCNELSEAQISSLNNLLNTTSVASNEEGDEEDTIGSSELAEGFSRYRNPNTDPKEHERMVLDYENISNETINELRNK